MKFTVDGKKAFELLEWQKSLIKNDIPSDIFESDMKRRAVFCVCSPMQKKVHSCRQDFCKALKDVGVKEVPGDLEALTEFIGSRKDLGLEQSENLDGCSLECDSIHLHKVTCATLCLSKTYGGYSHVHSDFHVPNFQGLKMSSNGNTYQGSLRYLIPTSSR